MYTHIRLGVRHVCVSDLLTLPALDTEHALSSQLSIVYITKFLTQHNSYGDDVIVSLATPALLYLGGQMRFG